MVDVSVVASLMQEEEIRMREFSEDLQQRMKNYGVHYVFQVILSSSVCAYAVCACVYFPSIQNYCFVCVYKEITALTANSKLHISQLPVNILLLKKICKMFIINTARKDQKQTTKLMN